MINCPFMKGSLLNPLSTPSVHIISVKILSQTHENAHYFLKIGSTEDWELGNKNLCLPYSPLFWSMYSCSKSISPNCWVSPDLSRTTVWNPFPLPVASSPALRHWCRIFLCSGDWAENGHLSHCHHPVQSNGMSGKICRVSSQASQAWKWLSTTGISLRRSKLRSLSWENHGNQVKPLH